MKYCQKCGTQVNDDVSFCPKCGFQFIQPPPPPTLTQQPQQQTPLPQPKPFQPTKKSKPTVLIGIVIAVIIIIIIASYIFVFKNDDNGGIFNGGGSEKEKDSDGDGIPDKDDAFPNDKNEWLDTNEDGVGDNADKLPNNPTQWEDRDGDGYGDNPNGIDADALPDDPKEWNDTDSDGVGDNADIYDNGNGALKISITYYEGDGGSDESGAYDPYFILQIDTNGDGEYDINDESKHYSNSENLNEPYSYIYDAQEDITEIKFVIGVWDDDDLSDDDQLDYCQEGAGYSWIHTVNSPFSNNWDNNGNADDRNNENDCRLVYKIEVVKV